MEALSRCWNPMRPSEFQDNDLSEINDSFPYDEDSLMQQQLQHDVPDAQSSSGQRQQKVEKSLPMPQHHISPSSSQIPFPFKLFNMLEDIEKQEMQYIVSWMPSGRSFKVHKPSEFVILVAPHYFSLTKYKSFKRQLLNYGFTRLDDESVGAAFCHPSFHREHPEKCKFIVRTKKAAAAPQKAPPPAALSEQLPASDSSSSNQVTRIGALKTAVIESNFEMIEAPDSKPAPIDIHELKPSMSMAIISNSSRPNLGPALEEKEENNSSAASIFPSPLLAEISFHPSQQQQKKNPPIALTARTPAASAAALSQPPHHHHHAGFIMSDHDSMLRTVPPELFKLIPGNVEARTMEWILNGAVVLPELLSVLQSYNTNPSTRNEPRKTHDSTHDDDDIISLLLGGGGGGTRN
jgi:hypothetical protein